MKLQRESIKVERRPGWHLFCIYDSNPELLEAVEQRLCDTQCSFTIGGECVTWDNYCDNCPCYEDGYGSGFCIPVEDVEEFKSAWKKVKK